MSEPTKEITSEKTSDTDLPTPSPEELKTPLGLVPENEGASPKKKVLTGLAALIFLGLVIGLSVGLTNDMNKEEQKDTMKVPVNDVDAGTNTTDEVEEPDWCGNGACTEVV